MTAGPHLNTRCTISITGITSLIFFVCGTCILTLSDFDEALYECSSITEFIIGHTTISGVVFFKACWSLVCHEKGPERPTEQPGVTPVPVQPNGYLLVGICIAAWCFSVYYHSTEECLDSYEWNSPVVWAYYKTIFYCTWVAVTLAIFASVMYGGSLLASHCVGSPRG